MRIVAAFTGLIVVVSLVGCADLARVSQPADAYTTPEKPLTLPKCAPPQAPAKAEGPNTPSPMQQEAASNCR
ncbi:MAG: hypothetical protein ACTHLA_08975 [Asticcacaulis sp.]|uniref:hypothetical protein n=1 Tax=Asticcacaulis sp. TaxID=1872648 RepID=UPI003F7C2FA5